MLPLLRIALKYFPDRDDDRIGTHIASDANACVKRIPCPASRSKFGVATFFPP